MASSDEEGEIVLNFVTNYQFVDHDGEPISFSVLPLLWEDEEIAGGLSTNIFLLGSADTGLQKLYKKVIAWKFELCYVHPEISVLSKDKVWINLQKPRKGFTDTIKTTLVTIHYLHFIKKNPETSRGALWNHLLKCFSSYEVEPTESDLFKHMPLINEAASRDKDLAKSECLATFLLEKPRKKELLHEKNLTMKQSMFIVEGDGEDADYIDDECDEDEYELFDYVCALCDNGGELLWCEGRCMRSFHATPAAGAESCESLGYTDVQVEAILNFMCKNCQYQQHQCFICGILGSSNKSSGTEVFPCVSATCGHFYHPKCVAKLCYPGDKVQASKLQKKISAGESFTCPAHKCFVCEGVEDRKNYDLQFAVCRRCPKAYHRKCLPRDIAFKHDGEKNIQQRAWDGLLPNRILIYCLEHKIIPQIGTPERNHIIFPDADGKKKRQIFGSSRKLEGLTQKRSITFGNLTGITEKKMPKLEGRTCDEAKGDGYIKKLEKRLPGHGSEQKNRRVTIKASKGDNKFASAKVYKSSGMEKSKLSLRNDLSNSSQRIKFSPDKFKHQNLSRGLTMNMVERKPDMKKTSKQSSVDVDIEKSILRLIKNSTSTFDLEEFRRKHERPSTHAYSSKLMVDKTITEGKVEGSVKAIREALKKLEEGCSVEDAKVVCEPEVLTQIIKWKRKLQVYIAPFLHGMRYTSFGRHFTKLDKLREIVDRLCWYVQDADTIVDFCCGSNDFSCLMKEKLNEMGKQCSFRNFDLIQPKNDFSFEKRDWMTVQVGELPAGSQLIMGLNPPFGVQASLANKFIDNALKFKPKLLVLIVPKETERLEEKDHPYDLVWEDDQLLAGKSFYLPGSVDANDKLIEQWNLNPPPLYLWSRPDWTIRHQAIAQSRGHVIKNEETKHQEDTTRDCYRDFSSMMNDYSGDISSILDDVPEVGFDDNVNDEANRAYFPSVLEAFNVNDRQTTLSAQHPNKGKKEIRQDNMSMDMELSSPDNVQHSFAEEKPYINPEIPHSQMNAAGDSYQYLQPGSYGHNPWYDWYGMTAPNDSGQMNMGMFQCGSSYWQGGGGF